MRVPDLIVVTLCGIRKAQVARQPSFVGRTLTGAWSGPCFALARHGRTYQLGDVGEVGAVSCGDWDREGVQLSTFYDAAMDWSRKKEGLASRKRT